MTSTSGANQPSYTFRPAALSAHQTFRIDDADLIASDAAGATVWRLPLGDVAQLAFVVQHVRGVRMRRLDLIDASGRILRSISRTEPTLASPGDPGRAAFEGLVAAVAGAIAERAPEMPVALEERGWPRLAMFAIGAVALAAGAAIGVGGIGNDRPAAFVPAAIVLLFGVVIGWANAPWRRPLRTTAAGLADQLRGVPEEGDPAAPRAVTPPPGE